MKKVFILNGPNLNMLGKREVNVYGSAGLTDITKSLEDKFAELSKSASLELPDFELAQTNNEHEAIELIHQLFNNADVVAGLIINPGAWTHYSYALHDALAMLKSAKIPVIELHISQPQSREKFRHNSVVSSVASATISGLGIAGYALAYQYLCEQNTVSQRGEEAQ